MAVNLNTNSRAQAVTPVAANNDWKAAAFINVYLGKGEGRRKVGALPLKASKNFDAALIKRLSEDPESIEAMVGMLDFDFQLVNAQDGGAGTTLPF